MTSEPRSFEAAITSADFSCEDYCGPHYAAKSLHLPLDEVLSLVERGKLDAWKTLSGQPRIALKALGNFKRGAGEQRVPGLLRTPLRVLVVEDDEPTRLLYQHRMGAWALPLDFTWMSSALDALLDAGSLKPDLLITDLSMPGVDGLEMLNVLRRNKQLARMHMIVISSIPEASLANRGGLPKDARLFPKPLNFDWLEGYITALLGTRASH